MDLKKNRRYITNTFVAILVVLNSNTIIQAQDFRSDMKKLHDWYTTQENLNLEVNAKIYSSRTVLSTTQKGILQKKGNDFLYTLDDSEMLVTGTSLIIISRYNKRIIYRKLSAKEKELLVKSTYTGKIDSLSQQYDSIAYELTGDQLKHYTVYTSKEIINKTDLWLDQQTGALRKMVYYYNPSLYKSLYKGDIVFTDVTKNKPVASDAFSEEKIIQKTGTTYKSSIAYKDYELKIVNDKIIEE